jgi:hypothetical protein
MKKIFTVLSVLFIAQVQAQTTFFGGRYQITASASNLVAGSNHACSSSATAVGSGALLTTNFQLGSTYNNRACGVWHNGVTWNAYNEDITPLSFGTGFNLLVLNGNNGTVLSHVSSATTNFLNGTVIDHPALNNNANAIPFFTHRFTSTTNTYSTGSLGIYFNGSNWEIFEQDFAQNFKLNSEFTIFVPSAGNNNAFVHTATPANINAHVTRLNHPLLNNNPNAQLQVVQRWDNGIYNNQHVSVYFEAPGTWCIYNNSLDPMPLNATFGVLVPEAAWATELNSTDNDKFNFECHPTFATNNIEVTWPSINRDAQVSLYTFTGELISIHKVAIENKKNIDVSSLAIGSYYAVYNDGTITKAVRFAKQ